MFGWLPIIGPIIDGIVSVFNKFQDNQIVKYKTDAGVVTTEIKASTETLNTFKDDIGVRLCRDLIMFPVSVWCAIATWDTIVAKQNPELMYTVASFPQGPLELLPHAVLAFLFGVVAMNIWKR